VQNRYRTSGRLSQDKHGLWYPAYHSNGSQNREQEPNSNDHGSGHTAHGLAFTHNIQGFLPTLS
jgi:hypothetical protein